MALTRPDDSARLGRRQSNRLRYDTPGPVDRTYTASISRDLIEYLDRQFPDRLPSEGTSLEELHKLQGVKRLVEHLREVYTHQQEEEDDLPNVLRKQQET